jgi:hypothetical protein
VATSNQFNFPNIDADYVIRDAFERCGIDITEEAGIRYEGARRSLDFLLSHWINLGLNLFTVQQGIIPIISGQSKFELPQTTLSKILECNLAKANQILGGTASSIPVNAEASRVFQTTPGACLLTAPNGSFIYTYPQGQPITYVGVLSNATLVYTLFIQCAFTATPAEADWITVLETPATTYYVGQTQWWALPFQKSALSWRIIETGGAILNIGQILLDISYQTQPMRPTGRDLYFQFSSNNQTGSPTTYWADRSSQPALNVYPYANTDYQFFIFNYTNYIADVGSYFNSLPIVGRFLEAACSGLAAKLALKYAFDRYESLKNEADNAYIQAGGEDTEYVDSIVNIGTDGWQ